MVGPHYRYRAMYWLFTIFFGDFVQTHMQTFDSGGEEQPALREGGQPRSIEHAQLVPDSNIVQE